ncbi:MAG: hypothetical protein QUV05_19845 [Phycisphaerae bacterium]|nr:hypothetical protein [Phycisphaerae bacterium]
MNHHTTLLATGWIDVVLVVAILLAATTFLAVLVVRFFRGQITCMCDRRRRGCPTTRMNLSLDQLAKDPLKRNEE